MIAEAEKLRAQRDKQLADYQAIKTGNAILPGLVKALKKLVKVLAERG